MVATERERPPLDFFFLNHKVLYCSGQPGACSKLRLWRTENPSAQWPNKRNSPLSKPNFEQSEAKWATDEARTTRRPLLRKCNTGGVSSPTGIRGPRDLSKAAERKRPQDHPPSILHAIQPPIPQDNKIPYASRTSTGSVTRSKGNKQPDQGK